LRVLVTGSSGHLGEALVRTLRAQGRDVVGLDLLPSPYTSLVGSISDADCVRRAMDGVTHVLHIATLHKPHVATHPKQTFINTNVTGTLTLLEEAVRRRVNAFIFTSTFGSAMRPPKGAPAAWVTEDLTPVPRNIYGATKCAAEDLCQLFSQEHGLPCLVLRSSRFFPEADDDPAHRALFTYDNSKVNEFLYRRVDIQDAVDAHLLAMEKAPSMPFTRFIISATTPFTQNDLAALGQDGPSVVARYVPEYRPLYKRLGWRMLDGFDRVYENRKARDLLGWRPVYDFRHVVERLAAGEDFRSPLASAIDAKGYHRGLPPDT
jgi:UDP-glucose 4-epimerase